MKVDRILLSILTASAVTLVVMLLMSDFSELEHPEHPAEKPTIYQHLDKRVDKCTDDRLTLCADGIGKYYECSARCSEMKIKTEMCIYICGGDHISKNYR